MKLLFVLTIVQAESNNHIQQARDLFREYENWLGLDLCFQGFEQELRDLPGKYALPAGRLFLAYSDDELAGCIAMRKFDDTICEMKRLFVRDQFRGQKIGVELIEKLIKEALSNGECNPRETACCEVPGRIPGSPDSGVRAPG